MGDTIYTYIDDFSEGRDCMEEGGGNAGEGDFGKVEGGGGVIPAEVFHGDIVASQSLRRYSIGQQSNPISNNFMKECVLFNRFNNSGFTS